MSSLFDQPFSIFRSFRSLRLLSLAFGVGCVVAPGVAGASRAASTPFSVGEVLNYDLKWGMFKVGKARMEVRPMTQIAGERAWHFVFQVHTNSFADRFYKVRTRIDSYVSEDLQRTLHYVETKKEGSTHREIEVLYDWINRTATYSNFGEARAPLSFGDGPVLDPLGAVYHLRAGVSSASGPVHLTVVDGKKAAALRLHPEAEERVKVNGKRWNSLVFEPQTGDLGGAFEKSADSELRIWLAHDAGARPLQVQGEVAVGSFWARMVN